MARLKVDSGSNDPANEGMVMLTGEKAQRATQEVLGRLAREAIMPNVDSILAITRKGDLPVLVFEPGEEIAADLTKGFGWAGQPVFGLPKPQAAALFGALDDHTSPWILGAPPMGGFRLFVFINDGTLLVNWAPGCGLSLEPDSYGPGRLN